MWLCKAVSGFDTNANHRLLCDSAGQYILDLGCYYFHNPQALYALIKLEMYLRGLKHPIEKVHLWPIAVGIFSVPLKMLRSSLH